jgi:hypothetical protein
VLLPERGVAGNTAVDLRAKFFARIVVPETAASEYVLTKRNLSAKRLTVKKPFQDLEIHNNATSHKGTRNLNFHSSFLVVTSVVLNDADKFKL